MAGGFGVPYRAQSTAAVTAGATPASGNTAETIWHQLYDTQLYTSAATVVQNYFLAAGVDPTISNMQQGGTLPSPLTLSIYDITLDILSLTPVSTNAGSTTVAGVLNDFAFIIFGSLQRPTWTLTISQKAYGPYSLTVLHGTGGPTGFGWGAEVTTIQYARNEPGPGWNYYGRVSILQQNPFSLTINWAAAATLTGNVNMRVSLFGVLNRRVL